MSPNTWVFGKSNPFEMDMKNSQSCDGNNNKRLHILANVLGVCGSSPIPPGRLVLSVTISCVDVLSAKRPLTCPLVHFTLVKTLHKSFHVGVLS